METYSYTGTLKSRGMSMLYSLSLKENYYILSSCDIAGLISEEQTVP